MERTERIGVFGGTFDPIHIGHLVLAEVARAQLALDRVLFIPTAQSVFKRDIRLTPAATRRTMCELACADNDAFEVDDREIVRGGQSYTIDTLRELQREYPSAAFYMIVGSDVLAKLDQWREAAQIAELATIAAFERPNEAPDSVQLKRLEALGFRVERYKGPQLVVHSSELRRRVSAGEPIRYLVPEPVRRLIEREGLYQSADEAAGIDAPPSMTDYASACSSEADETETLSEAELLSKETYRSLKAELADRVGPKRYRHSVGVAKTAKHLAEVYGVDPKKARLAGILHDWDKAYDDEGMRAHVQELGMTDVIDPWSLEHAPGLLHGHTAAKTMRLRFPALPADVEQAIERHTTAAPDMSDLDKVLYIADALEPSRDFRNLDDLRARVGEVSLDDLFFDTYELWTELLMERGRMLHPATIDLWNGYVAARERRKGDR